MAIQIAVIIFFLILVKISCKCDQKLDCFDQRVSKCVQIDGVEFIGREMKNGYCVTDSIQYDKIDFCISKQENVCITQDRKSCVKIQKSKNIVAITEEGICIGIYENASQQSRPLIFRYIKDGYCQDQYGFIKIGLQKRIQNFNNLCQDLSIQKCDQFGYCFSILNNQCIKKIEAFGTTIEGICVIENQYYNQMIQCNITHCKSKNKFNQYACIRYESPEIRGRTSMNECIKEGYYFSSDNFINCKPQYCVHNINNEAACILINDPLYPDIRAKDQSGKCLLGLQLQQQIYSNKKRILIDCSSQTCLIGATSTQIGSSLLAVGQDGSGNCVGLNQATTCCSSKIQNICYDPSSQVCKQLDNSSLYGYCVNNGNCQQIDINQFIGRDTNFNCLTSLQQLNLGQTIQYCFNDPQSICQKSDQTSCVKYQDNYQIYLGYISGTGFCAQQNQKTSNIQLQQITNLNPNFCQDENFQIVQIQIPYVGRETNYSKCLKVNSQANSLIEFCISGYCIWNNTCQQIGFDKINISKLSNLQCAPQQQPGAIECGYRYLNVCMLNQMCYWLTNNNPQFSGVDQNGNCIALNQYVPNLLKCAQNNCYKTLNNQNACFNFDGSQGAVGIDSNGKCLNFGQTTAIRCFQDNTICFANNACYQTITYGCILNGKCFQYSLNQYIGRDTQLQCLTSYQQVTQVESCFNDQKNVCLVDQTSVQFCVVYMNDPTYLGYIVQSKQCAVQDQVTIQQGTLADLVNLRQDYCQDTDGYIRQLDGNQYVGVDKSKYQCLEINQQITQPIQCYTGFCIISNQYCQKYDSTYVGKNIQHQCLKQGEKISIECTKDYCIDLIQSCCVQINDNDPQQSGVQNNFKCAVSGQYYSSLKQQCSQNYCIQIQQQPSYMEGCFLFDAVLQRVGIDQDGYCLQKDQPNAVRCMKGQFCLNQQNENQCQQLLLSYDSNRFARQKDTQYCLPYLDPNKLGDEIETCVSSTCLYTDSFLGQYCLIQGYIYNGDLIVGTDINQGCIIQDEITTNKIESCYGLTYCILDVGGGYKCQQLQESDPIYPDLIYKAKKTDQTCQDLNQPNSMGCLSGQYCINTQNQNQCQQMDPNNPQMVGRSEDNQQCIQEGVPGASACTDGYCLLNGECQRLSPEYPGKENGTYSCLLPQSEGQYGASICYQIGFCLMENKKTKNYYCVKLDYNNPNAIGQMKDTQFCLKQGMPTAVMCDFKKYCIDPSKLSCILIDLTQGVCIDKNGFCSQSGQCSNCEISQCLSSSASNTCQDLVLPSKYQCKDINGICQSLESSNCYICPTGYCLIDNMCKGSTELLKLVQDKSCFIYEPKSNSCILNNLNVPNQIGNMNCMNSQSFCQDISINNHNCLECPIYYFNPGNQKCYNLEQKLQLSPIPQQLSFDMNLIYIKQDCYDNQNCILNPLLKCPKGCYSCNSPTFCTQCIEGYFLYQQGSKQQTCIQCSQMILQDLSLKPYYNKIPIYECLDCSSEYGIWQQSQSQYKTCTNFKISLDDVLQIQLSKQQALNYKVQQIINQFQLISYQSKLCSLGCKSCIQSSDKIAVCVQCQDSYVLNNGICEQCPNNCLNCQYATFIAGKAVFKAQIDQKQFKSFIFVKICLQCADFYLVSYDLYTCIQCETNCKKCQYENYLSVLNYNQAQLISYSLDQITQQNFIKKCTLCQNGYFTSFDGQSCVKNINNCDYSTIKIEQGANQYDLTVQIWSYVQNIQNVITTQICKNCAQGYLLSSDKTRCSFGCLSQTKDKKCSNCFTPQAATTNPSPPTGSTQSVQCYFCKGGYILNQVSKIYRCQEDLCKNNIIGCQKCFKYQDPSSSNQNDQIYQCIQCIDQYSIPSLLQCKKCPTGCSKCYEGTRNYNFTSELLYERTKLTIDERLKFNLNNFQLFCTQCQDGYYLNQQSKSCIQIKCGSNCLKCILINNQPQCIQCNYDKLLAQLSQLTYFIGTFYFKSNYIPDPHGMITLTSSGDDCQICPILCETCINNSDTSLNPLFLYDAQCLSCKQTLDQSYILQDYTITYDKSRKKCYLCQNTEQGCYYKKQKIIYAQCLDLSSRIGDGSEDQPMNFSRLSEVNLDEFIINEIDYNQAIIYYNELQVKELEVQLIFVDDTCKDYKPQIFGITIKDSFRTLTTSLNITTLNSSFVLQFMQLGEFTISGFDKVYIENISFQQQRNSVSFGLIILENLLQDIYLINCQFQQVEEQTSNQYLTLTFSKVQQANVIFQQVVFQNILINNAQSLINVYTIEENSEIYLEINSSQLINNILSNQTKVVILDSTQDISLISINSKFNTNFTVQNVTLASFSAYSLVNKPIISKISFGFYFQSATTKVNILNSAFTNLDLRQPFNWIQGLVKQISLISCNFSNINNYFNTTSVRNGGFFTISTEQLDIKYSQFIFGQALMGGAIHLTIQNYGKLDIFKSTFQNNIAFSQDDLETQGGAIYIDATYSRTFDIFVIRSEFSNNFAFNTGGALNIKSLCQKGAVIIQKSFFLDNFSSQGSSINIQNYFDSQAKIVLSSVKINNQIQNTSNLLEQLSNVLNQYKTQIIQSSEPSQVYIGQASNIQILFSRFQIVPSQNINDQQSQFKELLYQKLLIINDAQNYFDLNNIYEKSVFFENLIMVKNTQNIYMYDTQISNNYNINKSFQKQGQNIQNIAFLSSQTCLISNLTVTNNVCYQCNFGILQIFTSSLLVQDSVFINNIAQYGSSLFIEQTKQPINSPEDLQDNFKNQLIISNSKFTNNKAIISGGALYIKESSVIINKSIFEKNYASQYGGAIYLENNMQNILKFLINLANSTFSNNQASFGGALGSTTGQRVNKYSSCVYKNNQATYHGQNIQTAPTQFNVSINNEYVSSQNIIIYNHQGGSFQDKILIRLSNEQNENILNIPLDSFLLITLLGDNGFLNQNKITHQNGIFNLTQQIQVYGNFGKQLSLQITSDLIQIPQLSQSGYVINYINKSIILNVQTIQQCQVGQIPKAYKNQFDSCQDCKDTQYSFVISNTCQKCPSSEAKCYKNKILLPANLWRVSQTSAVLYPCKNCVGDIKLSKGLKHRNLFNVKRTDLNYYCKQGYVGALCEDCDRSGQSWGDQYYMNLDQKCKKCSDITFTEIIYPLIILISIIVIPLFTANRMHNYLKIKLMAKTIYVLFKKFYGNHYSNDIRIIKFFVFQLSIIGIMFSYDSNIPNMLIRLFVDIGNLFPTQLRVTECFLQQIFQESRIINNSIYLFLGICFFVIIYLAIHNTFIKTKFKYKGTIKEMVISISIFLYFSLIAILSKIFRSVYCQKFGDVEFVMEYLSLNCSLVFQTYYDLSALILVIVALLSPFALIIFRLYRARYFLKMYKYEYLYGFFTLDYKQQFYLWDFVKIGYKLILFLIFYYSYLISQLQIVISIIISLSYSLLVFRYKPYESEKLNQIDFKIQYLTAICFSINTMQQRINQQQLELLCTIGLLCIVALILHLILFQLNHYQMPKYIKIIKFFQSKSPKCEQIIQKLGLDQHVQRYLRVQMTWQKIRQIFPKLKQLIYLKTNISQCGQIDILNQLYSNNKIQIQNKSMKTISQIINTQ